MTFGAIFTGIIAIAKAVPMVMDAIDKFYDMWVSHKINEADASYNDIENQREAMVKAISKAESKDDRRALSIILHNISNQ